MKKLGAILALSILALAFLPSCDLFGFYKVLNTTWNVEYVSPVTDEDVSYNITFNANGDLDTDYPNDNSPDNDFWEQAGPDVVFTFNDEYVTFTGTVFMGKMSGEANNIAGLSWDWTATKQ